MQIIITSPSLDPRKNVSGISSVTQFIISNNSNHEYIHFELGRKDGELGGIFRIGAILRSLFAWRKLLRQYPDAIIHYNFPLEKPSLLRDPMFMSIARRHKRKMVVHIHGGVFLTAPHIPFPFQQILSRVLHWGYPIIVLSDAEKRILQERYQVAQIIILPNCVDLSDAIAHPHIAKLEEQPLVIGYLGRIASTKGMDYLLEACEMLQKQGVPFLLRIAGAEETKDQYLPSFYSALGRNFEYCGLVSGQQKADFLRSLDILAMPTFFEGLPMSLLECMSYGAVPVITPVGSIPEVVKDGENGLFIKVRDAESLADSICYLHANREGLLNMSHHARTTILTTFPPARYISSLNSLYSSL